MNPRLTTSIGVIALLGLLFHLAPPAGETAKTENANKVEPRAAQKKEDAAPAKKVIHQGPWLATCRFAGEVPPQKDNQQPIVPSDFCLDDDQVSDFIIATVPDPAHTRFGYFADRSLESIERAVTNSGWYFDSQWLPWKRGTNPDDERAWLDADETYREPGILLFRREDRLLVVFVVGETPTSGIDRMSLKKAICYGTWLSKETSKILIDGPSFSGSMDSLKRIMGSRIYKAFSGSVTNSASRTKLPDDKFLSAIHDSAAGAEALRAMARMLRIPDEQVAILAEDETPVGQGFNSQFRTIRFPREISSLRNAVREAAAPSGLPNADSAGNLPLSLHDSDGGEDSLPVLSRAYSPQSQYAVIESIVAALRTRVRLVEIVASNTLDTLFLASQIRAGAPNIRIVTHEADMLFVREAREQGVSGIFSLTTYPLFADSSEWMRSMGSDWGWTPNGSSYATGVYNASVLLLREIPGVGNTPLEAYALENSSQGAPPMWLTEATPWGYWPIQVFSRNHRDPGLYIPPAPLNVAGFTMPLPPRQWWIFEILTCLFSGFLAHFVLKPAREFKTTKFDVFELNVQEKYLHRRVGLIFAQWILVVAVQGALCLPLLATSPGDDLYGLRGIALAMATTAVTCLAAAWVYAVCTSKPLTRQRSAWFLAASVIAAIGIGLLLLLAALGFRTPRGFLLAYRAIELTSGASPAVPFLLLFVALFLGAFIHLRRLSFACERDPGVPRWGLDYSAKKSLGFSWRRAADVLADRFCRLRLLAALVITLLCFLPRSWIYLASPNGAILDRLFLCLCFLLLFGLVYSTVLFRRVWAHMRLILKELDRLEMDGAFSRIPRQYSGAPIWQRLPEKRTNATFFRCIDCLREIKRIDGTFGLDGFIRDMEEYAKDIRCAERDHIREDYKAIAAVTRHAAGFLLISRLVPAWKSGKCDPRVGKDDKPEKLESLRCKDQVYRLAAEFVALRYATYIRYILAQLRNLMWFISGGVALLALALAASDVQSPQIVRWFLGFLVVAFGIATGLPLMQMDRDTVLSLMADDTPGELNKDFWIKLISYGALPLVGVLSNIFPSFSRFLFSWLQPTLQTLK
jgi:hypothetical protein